VFPALFSCQIGHQFHVGGVAPSLKKICCRRLPAGNVVQQTGNSQPCQSCHGRRLPFLSEIFRQSRAGPTSFGDFAFSYPSPIGRHHLVHSPGLKRLPGLGISSRSARRAAISFLRSSRESASVSALRRSIAQFTASICNSTKVRPLRVCHIPSISECSRNRCQC